INGVALALLIGGDRTTDRAMVGLMAVASAVESAGGLIYATTFGTSRGTAETVAVVAGLGTVFGMAAGGVLSIAPDDDNVPFYRNRAFIDENVRIYSGGGLIGSLAGAYVGHSLARAESYTRGDARVLAAAGLFGVNAGVLVVDFSDTRNARIGSGTVAIGTAVGMAAGHLLTAGRDFTAAEGSHVGLATIGGGLAGLAT